MILKFSKKKISGILTILPSKIVKFEDDMENYNFSVAKSMKLKVAMGYKEHRIAKEGQCSSDFCIYGMKYLFESGLLEKNSIDAMLFVSQSPDYFMPPTSNIIQGYFNMKHDLFCLDINQGCAGFEIGLIQAFMLLEQESINRVVLLNADVLSPKVSRRDRNSNPLIGDAASISIIDKCEDDNQIYCSVNMDGTGALVLNIPAGGFRKPSTTETAIMREDTSGNFRSEDNLVMQGDAVFNFVQREVPPMVESVLTKAGLNPDDVDWYMFHQPNKFMLNKLADKIGISRAKMPSNIVENFGNSSGVTVPVNICYNLGEKICKETYKVCLAGFGVGLTWSSIIMDLGNLDFSHIIDF